MVSKYNVNTFFKFSIMSLLVYTGYLTLAAVSQGKHYLDNLDQKKKDKVCTFILALLCSILNIVKTEQKEMAVQVKSDLLPSLDETIADILKINVPEHLRNFSKVEVKAEKQQ